MIFASPHMCDNLYAMFWGIPASYSLYYASSRGGKTSPTNQSTPTNMRWEMELCTPSHIWCGKNLPGSYCIRLREIFARHFTRCPYYPPMTEACRKVFSIPANNLTKETIYNDKFWTEIQTLLRQVVVRNGAEVIHDPFAKYLTLMRKLMLQIIAWYPTETERRDDMAREAHMLHHKIGLSKKRFGLVLHYFFEHFRSASSIMDL